MTSDAPVPLSTSHPPAPGAGSGHAEVGQDGDGALRAAATCDCRSEEGVIVGLIDGTIAQARIVARYLREHGEGDRHVFEALADLRADDDVARLLGRAS